MRQATCNPALAGKGPNAIRSTKTARVHRAARRRNHKPANSGKCATGSSHAHRGGADRAWRRCRSPKPLDGFRAGSQNGGLVRRPKPSHRVPLCRRRFWAHAGFCEGAGGAQARLHRWPQHARCDRAEACDAHNSHRLCVGFQSDSCRNLPA